jgi:hypothetical protein
MKKKAKIWVVLSVLWVILALAGSIKDQGIITVEYVFHWGGFLIVGLFPPIIGWGIAWVRTPDKENKYIYQSIIGE